MSALRADVEVLLEIGAVEHRVAGRALGPQALRHGLARAAAGALDLGRQEFLEPAHLSSASRIGRRKFLTRATACSGAPASISWMMRLPITTASAVSAPRRADSASRIPKPTPIRRRAAARSFRIRAATLDMSRCAAPRAARRQAAFREP